MKKLLFISAIFCLSILSCGDGLNDAYNSDGGSAAADPGLVGEYLFDGNANDTSGKGHDGIINLVNPAVNHKGTANAAYYLPMNSGMPNIYVHNNSDFAVNSSGAISVSIWFNAMTIPPAASANTIIIEQLTSAAGEFGWYIRLNLNQLEVGVTKNGYGDNILYSGVMQGMWYHIVLVYNNSNLSYYMNGFLQTQTGYTYGTAVPATGILSLGGHTLSGNMPYEGSVDDLRIYNYALTPEEIQDLYTQ